MKSTGMWISFLLLFFLVGCSSVQVGSSSVPEPTSLHIERINANKYARQYPPFSKTIQDTNIVQHLYQEAHSLPPAPTQSCPPSTGNLIYRLDFYQGTVLLQEMNLGVTGCTYLSLSKVDIRIPDNAFLQFLKQALHLDTLVPRPL